MSMMAAMTKSICFLLLFSGCGGLYPEVTSMQLERGCEQDDVLFSMPKDAGECPMAQKRVVEFRRVFQYEPGFNIERTRNHSVYIAENSDGGAFYSEFWKMDVGGLTNCIAKQTELATYDYGLVHELAHAAEGCPCVTMPDAGYNCHIGWNTRGVYRAIDEAQDRVWSSSGY
jgi:hypothetical protein